MSVRPEDQFDRGAAVTDMQTTHAFININTQFENAGDALILRELIRLVSARVKLNVYHGGAPAAFADQLDLARGGLVDARPGESLKHLVRDVLIARTKGIRCYVFLTPGAPKGERSRKQFATDCVRILLLAILRLVGVRICQVGVSFEHLGPRHARLLRWRSRLLYASLPREQIAAEYARRLGIRVTGMTPDLSFNLFSRQPHPARVVRDGIGFSFRVDKDQSTRMRIREIVREVIENAGADQQLIFVAQVGRDVEFMKELYDLAQNSHPGRAHFIDCHQDIEQAVSSYARCRTVLSNRLHALLPSLWVGANPVALIVPELDPKITGVFEAIDLQDRVFDLRTFDMSKLHTVNSSALDFDGVPVAAELERVFDSLLTVPPRRVAS